MASRPYTSGLGRSGGGQGTLQATPYTAQSSYNAPQPNTGGFGTNIVSTGSAMTQQQREAQRLERERQERAEREIKEAQDRGVLERLSEEHMSEINEAVRTPLAL